MSLQTAIKFRYLACQLTQAETLQFIQKLINEPNKIIITALFNYFIESSNQCEMINNLLSKIIRSRKDKPKTIATQKIKLDHVPKPLIGLTASFLNQSDYINFSKTNRYIHLGSNTPNLMQKLDITDIKNYSSINLALYPSIKTLTLNMNKFNDLIPPNPGSSILNELRCLTLTVNGANQSDIDPFITQNHINMANVSQLSCEQFGTPQNVFPFVKFEKLLTKFPNIQYFSFRACAFNDIDMNKFDALYPDLKGLELICYDDATTSSFINGFGNKLDFLSLFQKNDTDFNLHNVNFNKLKELKLYSPTIKSINDILSTAINLEKLRIESKIKNSQFMEPKETKEMMINLITKCKYLQCIAFCDDGKLIMSVLEGIEKGLFEIRKRKKKSLKIHIAISCDKQFKPHDLILNIGNISNWLLASEINDFMFILALKKLNNKIDGNVIMRELAELPCNINVKRVGSVFVITNKNCHINGYRTKWKLEI